jgi:hypothetical protein
MTDRTLSPLDQLAHDLIEDRLDHLGLGHSVVEQQWQVTVADPGKLDEARRHAQFIAKLVHETMPTSAQEAETTRLKRLHATVLADLALARRHEKSAAEHGFSGPEVTACKARVSALDWVLQRIDEELGR